MAAKRTSTLTAEPLVDPADARLQALMASANTFQAESTRLLRGSNGRAPMHKIIRSGILELDMATGIGGLPRGRIIEISGRFSCGKTTAAMHFVAQAQRDGIDAVYFDAEYALQPRHMKKLGVNLERLPVVSPDNLEQAIELMLHMMENYVGTAVKPKRGKAAASTSGEEGEEEVDPNKPALLIIVDSVAALKGRAVMEGDVDQQFRAQEARIWSQNLPKLTLMAAKTDSTIVLINQERSTMATNAWEAKTTTSGGEAIRYGTSIRITMKGQVEKAKLAKGQKVEDSLGGADRFNATMTLGKNKVGSPATIARFSLVPGFPIDPVQDVFAAALRRGFIIKDHQSDWDDNGQVVQVKKGNWFTYPLALGDLDLIRADEKAAGVSVEDSPFEGDEAALEGYYESGFMKKFRLYPSLVDALRERILDTLNDEDAKVMDADGSDEDEDSEEG